MGVYNSDPLVNTLVTALSQNSDAKGKLYSRMIEVHSNTADDFSLLEGAAGSDKPFWVKKELAADGGDKIRLTVMGDAAGPGVRGEAELTGNTSTVRFGGYEVQVDFWRDAVEFTKKELKFLSAGGAVMPQIMKMMGEKLGRQKQRDMMIKLRNAATTNIIRPNNRTSRDLILATDTISPSFLVSGKARLQGLGGKPTGLIKSASGSPVYRYLAFAGQDALTDVRNSNSYQNAILQAMTRSDENPAFSGRLLDWQGIGIWEHTIVDPDADDTIGSPIAPKAILGVAIPSATTTVAIQASTSTKPRYFQDFPGYDYQWVEGQTAAPDSNTYYAWIIDPAQGGKAMFVAYTGTANNGNQITAITARLGSSVTGIQNTTVGSITYDSSSHTDNAAIGSWIIPANSKGTPIGYSFVFGAGAALRGYGSITASVIEQKRDYDFVMGTGREAIFGQELRRDTQGRPRSYMLLEHAISHPGITILGTWGV